MTSAKLLNHSTSIEAEKTIGEIAGMLVKHGVANISNQYNAGVCVGMTFTIVLPNGVPQEFALPVHADGVHTRLTMLWQKGQLERRYTTKEQAVRVGWRIVKDWVAAQVAIIEVGLARPEQVFMPYALVAPGVTLYERLAMEHHWLLPGEVA